MIAHTADDSLCIYTGLYGDRHGQPLSNSYKGYNPDGTTDPAASFAYWTSPFADTAEPARRAGHDSTPSMVYSDTLPARRRAGPDHACPLGPVHPRRLQRRRLLDREHGAGELEGRPADDLPGERTFSG